MAASSSGYPPLSWGDDPNNEIVQERVDGSHTGATLPPYIDPEGLYGELHLLRILGINGPLPNRPFHIRRSVEKFVGGKIDGAFPESIHLRAESEELTSVQQAVNDESANGRNGRPGN